MMRGWTILKVVGLMQFSFVVGCGSASNLAPVEGTVTMDGKPLADATVVFINGQSSTSGARTDAKGFYRLTYSETEEGAVPGKNTVRISTVRGSNITEDGKTVPGKPETVPMKYNAQSTLEFNVEPNKKNIADWKLESKGPILSTE